MNKLLTIFRNMTKAYSSELRLRSLKLIEQGNLKTEVSDLMGLRCRVFVNGGDFID